MAVSGRKNEELLIVALASGRNIGQAAKASNLSERTAYRRLTDPDFKRKVAERRCELVNETAGRLTAAGMTATLTLQELLASESDSVRLGAARSILELGTKIRESTDLETRITSLEKIVEENNASE